MRVDDFDFDLPEELIAKYPLAERSSSRLLRLDKENGQIEHRQFRDLLEILEPGDCLVFNNTRVIPARLFGQKATGGKVEILVERMTSERSALVHIRASKAPKPGTVIRVGASLLAVRGRQEALFEVEASDESTLLDLLEQEGHMPLPPYIDRSDEPSDRERYQTVYSEIAGAVAAPTAGLHFDDALLSALQEKGIRFAYVTLHVGAGTFQPVRVENVHDHQMHYEYIDVPQACCDIVNDVKSRGGRVVAVGTTSVRSLETAAVDGVLKPFRGDTNIFIFPGYEFQVVDKLITNFHLPKSTLLMLVSAFAGREPILKAYHEAIAEKYRFYSYGDAMLLS